MAWLYKVLDAKGEVFQMGSEPFATEAEAIAAGNLEKVRLMRTGNVPADGLGGVEVEQYGQNHSPVG